MYERQHKSAWTSVLTCITWHKTSISAYINFSIFVHLQYHPMWTSVNLHIKYHPAYTSVSTIINFSTSLNILLQTA